MSQCPVHIKPDWLSKELGVPVVEGITGVPWQVKEPGQCGASKAGLVAGDVIVRVGGEDVSSLRDLRFGIGYFERPIKLRVVRKGSPIDIVIGK